MLIVLAWTLTIVALVYGEENWRGRRAWNRCRQAIEARGEQLDFKAFIPKPVPAARNFAATPFFDYLFANKTNRLTWNDDFSRAESQVATKPKGDTGDRSFVDLAAWEMVLSGIRSGPRGGSGRVESGKLDLASRSNAAPAVLKALKASEPVFAELRAASSRPESRYPVAYDLEDPLSIHMPHLAPIKSVVQRLRVKACAELAVGQNQEALEDVKLMLRLGDSIQSEGFLFSYLVRISCFQIATQPLWEGLADHHWSDAQLQELEALLQPYDFLSDVKHGFEAERASSILVTELLAQRRVRMNDYLDEPSASANPFGDFLANLLSRIGPRGWYYFEQVNYCRSFDQQLAGTMDVATRRVMPAQTQANARKLERMVAGGRLGKGLNAVLHHRVIASLLLPALDKAVRKAAASQVSVDEARIACALQRFRLAEGRFPMRLEELSPRYLPRLPHDVITGTAYHYRVAEEGHFILYSVGWNERDDGGVPGRTLFDDAGDWIWEYPRPSK